MNLSDRLEEEGQRARDTGFVEGKEEEESWKKQVKKRSGRGSAGEKHRGEARRRGERGGRKRERERTG